MTLPCVSSLLSSTDLDMFTWEEVLGLKPATVAGLSNNSDPLPVANNNINEPTNNTNNWEITWLNSEKEGIINMLDLSCL